MGYLRQSTVLVEVFHTLSSSCLRPRSSHFEIWTLFLFFVQHLARQGIHVHVQLRGEAFGRISVFFPVRWCSDPAVDSHPAQFWFCWSRYALCCVPFDCRFVDAALVVDTGRGMCWLVLLVLMHVTLCGLLGLSCLAAWRSLHS